MSTENEEVINAGPDGKALEVTAAPAQKTPATEKQPDDGDGVVPFEYADVPDDPGLNIALKFVGKQGLSPDHPSIQAALQGDFSFLEAELASRGAKATGYEQILNLAKKSWENHVNKQSELIAATEAKIHETVGGAEQWAEIQAWAKANAEPAEKAEINKMLSAGGFTARAAASLLAQLHGAALGTVKEPAEAATKVPANGASPAASALDAEGFQKELSKLVKEVGIDGLGRSPEYAKLVARRQAHRG